MLAYLVVFMTLNLTMDNGMAVDPPTRLIPSASAVKGSSRPPCPSGWVEFKNPLIGIQAHVPANYWVRLRGGMMLTVEKQENPATMAFMLPFRPRAGAKARDIAEHFSKFVAQSDPQFKAQIVGEPAPDRALSEFHGSVSDLPVQGKFLTILGGGGTMAFVIGVSAAEGRLNEELPVLRQIAQSFGFMPAQGKWIDYTSPAGGFTMSLPQAWQVQSGDGQNSKDNIDWAAMDPQKPLSRAFQWCPRYCSPQLLQDPLHVIRGYQAAQFQDPRQVVTVSLSQIGREVKLLKMNENRPLTAVLRKLQAQTAQQVAATGMARIDIVVYDCLAQAKVDDKPVLVAFIAGIQTMAINGGIMGQLIDLSVTLRGWCAEPGQFVSDSPVLEKICASMQLTPAFLLKIMQGNEQAVAKIRETYAYMNRIDDQIRQSRWDTMDAIAEMNYDLLRDSGGYVNEKSGRIEQIAPDKVVKNSRGDLVSREEIERGVNPENATVLRGAYSDDYMRGVYGRIEF
jgi:hypothetical protein